MNKQATETRPVRRVTADTNVFYYLGAGTVAKTDVVREGEELWATPINMLEIVAGVAVPDEWNARKAAARAIVEHADRMAEDPEQHLAALIERREPGVGSIWLEGAKALSQATDERQLRAGVADFIERVLRSTNPSVASAAKEEHYEGFKKDMIRVCDDLLPGYQASVDAGTAAPVVAKAVRTKLRSYLGSTEFVAAVFFAGLAQRYATFGSKQVDLNDPTTFDALRDLAPYCAIYGAYLRELLTSRRKPEANDWGDLELFMYLQPDTFVATSEKKWWTIATHVGLEDRVRQITPT